MPESISGGPSNDRTTVVGNSGTARAHVDQPIASAGARMGRYLVIEELGRGSMGAVLRAYDPKLQREVALKVVHRDVLDDSAQERLVREARAMARLSHPNVVGVFDVEFGLEVVSQEGEVSAATGVVMVMEYVRGSTLRQWIEEQARTWQEVLAAFVQAGRGLAAAHAENVLHRDFKLTNVLIGTDERVRVTDFGLARTAMREPVEQDLDSSASLEISHDGDEDLTIAGTVMGTPLYMAPEQLVGKELDARADQFAFCVALWRAMTHRWPYAGRGRVLYDRKVAGPPRWPSDVAVPRHVVAAIRRGLSPDPVERWPSMLDLLTELHRDPRKKVRRILVWGTLGCLVLGGWGVQYVTRARARLGCAEQAERIDEVWNDQRRTEIGAAFESTGVAYARETWTRSTERLDAYAEAWRSVQVEACERVEVERTWAGELGGAARACLDGRLEQLSATLDELVQPDVALIHRAATASASLPLARDCLESTLRYQSESSLDPQRRAARAELSRASAAFAMGRYTAARDRAAALLTWTSAREDPAFRAEVQLVRGEALGRIGAFSEAREAFEAAFIDAGAVGRDELALRAVSLLLFLVGYQLAQHGEALQWERVGQMLLERLGDDSTLDVAGLMNNLGALHHSRGAFEEARAAFERALRISENVLGPNHLYVARSLNNLGAVYSAVGDEAEAQRAFARALTIREEVLGSHHPDVAATINNLAAVHSSMQAYEAALADHERALSIREEVLGPEHPDVAVSLNNLGVAQRLMGSFEDARASHERALAIREKVLDPQHPDVVSSLVNLGGAHQSLGDHAQAQQYFERALDVSERGLGPDHPHIAMALTGLGMVLHARGRYQEARATFERALAARESTFGPEHPTVADSLMDLAAADRALGDPAQAVSRLGRALAIREAEDTPVAGRATARWALAQALSELGTDRPRAHELAIAAREEYRSIGSDGERALSEIEAWLRRER